MFEDLLDDLWILDTSDDLYLASALGTRLYVYGEQYTISHQSQVKIDSIREFLRQRAIGLWQMVRHPGQYRQSKMAGGGETLETLQALNEVSFDIMRGERIGIVGKNGSGKSTLMRVLSRITEPTSGSVEITGSVASLLEVGTGFHPELSGRENIFLSGAIMGMTRKEIEARFDEIVAFSEVERFLDAPVKRYSSGMYVRLGFAVAAHLDAEILLIDEVLAVGDARFQRKCLAKMHEISAQGRTIVFISHQLVSVESLCTRLMVMSDGGIVYDGELKKGLEYYLQSDMREAVTPKWNEMDREGNGLARVSEFYIVSEQGARLDQVQSGQNISLVFGLDLGQHDHELR